LISRNIAVLAVVLTLAFVPAGHATNFCVSLGGGHAVASGFITPAKGTCSPFNGYYTNRAGFLLAGDLCRSSDGTTFLFNLFTQLNSMPDSIAGTWLAATGAGSGKECTSANCFPFDVKVTKCPNSVPIPKAASGFHSESSASFLSEEQ
jgi:hypothetical protein